MGVIKSDKCEQGSALVEAALMLPILILFIAGLVDLANSLDYRRVVSTATRHGARVAGALSHDSNVLCTSDASISATSCASAPAGTDILDKAVRATCDYIERDKGNLDKFMIEAEASTIDHNGNSYRAVNISTKTAPGAFCFFCPFNGFQSREIGDSSTFILEGCN